MRLIIVVVLMVIALVFISPTRMKNPFLRTRVQNPGASVRSSATLTPSLSLRDADANHDREGVVPSGSTTSPGQNTTPLTPAHSIGSPGKYVEVHGLKMYYEAYGAGRPIVLLHGGLATIQSSFSRQIPALARIHQVIAIEQMGHGHTADISERQLSYEGMAEDTATLLAQIGLQKADLIGWSDGGQIALRLAFTHPALVRRVIASGVKLGASNPHAAQTLSADQWPRAFRDEYGQVSPDGPRHWAVFFQKIRTMWAKSSWGISEPELARIKAPTLIIAGDRDYSRIEETTRIFRTIPNARLCILPKTGHTTFQDRSDWLNPIILDFLDRN